jgi:hypothetical protein
MRSWSNGAHDDGDQGAAIRRSGSEAVRYLCNFEERRLMTRTRHCSASGADALTLFCLKIPGNFVLK